MEKINLRGHSNASLFRSKIEYREIKKALKIGRARRANL